MDEKQSSFFVRPNLIQSTYCGCQLSGLIAIKLYRSRYNFSMMRTQIRNYQFISISKWIGVLYYEVFIKQQEH